MQDDDIIIERDGREEDGTSEVELEDQESRADTKLAKLRKELETCKEERQQHLDGWQRAKADYVNALKRFEEEKQTAKQEGAVKAARAFITVLDSLAHAERHGEIPDAFQGIAKQIHVAVASLGLESFGSVGEAFDPMLHEALGQDAVDAAEKDDTVTAVLEQGWKAGESVVRAAKVRVGSFDG
jgi:molecular chaperone GrpE